MGFLLGGPLVPGVAYYELELAKHLVSCTKQVWYSEHGR